MMKHLRILSLAGAVVALCAATVGLLDWRADRRHETAARAEAVRAVALASAQSAVEQLGDLARLAVGAGAVGEPGPPVGELAAHVNGVACSAPEGYCRGDGPVAESLADELAALGSMAADQRAAVAGVDQATQTIVAVATTGDRSVTVHAPIADVVGTHVHRQLRTIGARATVRGVDASPDRPPAPAGSAVALPLATGALVIETHADLPDVTGSALPYVLVLAQGVLLLAISIPAVVAERRRLERRAATDVLTGLANRDEFQRTASDVLGRRRNDEGSCLLVIDLDEFKRINDRFGHDTGDAVLRETAERLRAAVRTTDLVCRWGGDEFVVLLTDVADRAHVDQIIERILDQVAHVTVGTGEPLSVSIGAAFHAHDGEDLTRLLRAADTAMYEAKTRPGGSLRFAGRSTRRSDRVG